MFQRRLIDGVRHRVRTGVPWRDLPEEYGPWQTVYSLFRRWQREGVWAGLLTELQTRADAAGRIIWDVSVDSTISRAHQHATGAHRDGAAQKESPGGVETEPADHGLGRSRGGLTSKIHLACEHGQRLLSLVVTAGQRGDSPHGDGIDDPSEDALFMMIGELNHDDNTFVVIQPDTDDPAWFSSVSLLDEGGYEVELRDVRHREHELTVQHDPDRIARELTIWMAARNGAKPSAEF